MHVINVRNVHEALPEGLRALEVHGLQETSRNGPVKVMPTPVTTVFREPRERVMFWAQRDANPFFHFFESLWMLDGRNDVEFPAKFVKRMREFSDDGVTFHGAYGYRWRQHFGYDQLQLIAQTLKKNPDDRRQVLQMWDATTDLGREGKDFPCNTQVYFSVRGGKLDMTVCNRSNDVVWGAYGANAVHFSFLQEWVATAAGYEVGVYYQVSNNFHGYIDTIKPLDDLINCTHNGFNPPDNPYNWEALAGIYPYPIMNVGPQTWQEDLRMFMDEGPTIGFRDAFFRRVATPLWRAHEAYKGEDGERRFTEATKILEDCHARDWRAACEQWIARRHLSWKEKQNG